MPCSSSSSQPPFPRPTTSIGGCRIVNDSHVDIVAFYGVNVSGHDWQDSLLGGDVLRAGTSVVLNFDDGTGYCRFRFRAVFADGIDLQRQSVNVCDIGTYRYTD